MKKVIALVLAGLSFFTFADNKPVNGATKEKEKLSPKKIKAIADKALKTSSSTSKNSVHGDSQLGPSDMHGDDR